MNNAINKLNLLGICRKFYTVTAECIFFSRVHRAVTERHAILGCVQQISKILKLFKSCNICSPTAMELN